MYEQINFTLIWLLVHFQRPMSANKVSSKPRNSLLNRSSRRRRGMAYNPLFIICTRFFLHFPNQLCYGYIRFEGTGKIPLRKKSNQLAVFSSVLLDWDSQQGRPFSLPSQKNFPISFKPKMAIAEFFLKMQRKTWHSILRVDAKPFSPWKPVVNWIAPSKGRPENKVT